MRNAVKHFKTATYMSHISALSAGILIAVLLLLIGYIAVRGSGFFWPKPIYSLNYIAPTNQTVKAYAQVLSRSRSDNGGWVSLSTGNVPFQTQVFIRTEQIKQLNPAVDVAEIQLNDGRSVLASTKQLVLPEKVMRPLSELDLVLEKVRALDEKISTIRDDELAPIHERIAAFDRRGVSGDAPARERYLAHYERWQKKVDLLLIEREQYSLIVASADGNDIPIPLASIHAVNYPTAMSIGQKAVYAISSFLRFLADDPKQANTAGGIFPALFGTVVMVLLMTLLVAPFGILTAIYLHEYAPNNWLTASIRICISNMAAVPTIVYGVFGLGFLVYVVGGNIDALFFNDASPSPVMGSPGIFWAAVTMSLLTLPVVVVATEEGLSRVPQGLRRGSYALGATKSETIWHTVLPLASPSIMTGIILAIARAAGEVAPLMLVGAVRFAPNLPIDSEFPFLHLDRQFMHLGVLIYDGAFYSQTSPRGASMMFATCSLLLLVVLVLNIIAMVLRARLRERYQ